MKSELIFVNRLADMASKPECKDTIEEIYCKVYNIITSVWLLPVKTTTASDHELISCVCMTSVLITVCVLLAWKC